MFNTIILLEGYARLTNNEYEGFSAGDTVWGNDYNPTEIRRWSIEDTAAAKAELAKHRCTHSSNGHIHNITEYALEYCECDEDGDFVMGSDYDLAEYEEED